MPIKIIKQGNDLYTAEVTLPEGTWKSPHPMPSSALYRKLFRMGYDAAPDVYGYVAEITRPFLQEALAGEREVPEQEPLFTEAWLTDALYYYDRMLPLRDVLESADALEHAIPDYDEISWAFLRLRRRGWLAIDGEMYGLTPEGRRAVKKIADRWEKLSWLLDRVGNSSMLDRVNKLEKWFSKNAPPSDE
ncbi:MAG: hypothetical protein SA339_08050 [Methanomassiliicoccus sp.]|nr:hypothetical protein [Methanomassiliicoccus sp.]